MVNARRQSIVLKNGPRKEVWEIASLADRPSLLRRGLESAGRVKLGFRLGGPPQWRGPFLYLGCSNDEQEISTPPEDKDIAIVRFRRGGSARAGHMATGSERRARGCCPPNR